MLERDGYPFGVPCWVETMQPDLDAATAFYGDLLGWELQERTPAGAPQRYFVAQLRGRDVAGLGGQPEGGPPFCSHSFTLEPGDGGVEDLHLRRERR
jgi:uncharacterized protein